MQFLHCGRTFGNLTKTNTILPRQVFSSVRRKSVWMTVGSNVSRKRTACSLECQ
jgi:hypothetical protein